MKKFFTKEWWTIMKIGVTQLFLALSFCGVTLAHTNYAQVLDQKISVHVTDASLETALEKIGIDAEVYFSYSRSLIAVKDRLTFHADDKSLRIILNELLTPRKISFTVHDDGHTIFLKPYDDGLHESQSVIDTKEASPVWQQVTGILRDSQNQPIAGVNVLVKGTTNGTNTDVNGKYTINVEEGDVLVFSFIGFTSQEIRVGQQTTIDVMLQEDVKSLDEVTVNVGYWEVKQKEQTGSVSHVTADEIQKQNVSNPLQALQGRTPGVYISQSTGMPGGGIKIQVRGQNSLRNGSDGGVNGNLPLYLIDGVPFTSTSLNGFNSSLGGGNPLSSINPNDIESIEVLKDADATAIYGSRGANGVILITTKRAKAGKTKLDMDIYQGIGQVAHFTDLLTTPDYIRMRKEAFRNDNRNPTMTNGPDLLAWDTTRYTNWQKEFLGGTAHLTNSNISLSGGSATTQFTIGGSYYKESTVFPGSNHFQRGTGRLAFNHQSTDNRFRAEASANYSISTSTIPFTDLTRQAMTLAPNAPALYDDAGNLNWQNSTWTNPLALLRRNYKNTTDNLVTNLALSYEIARGLTLKSTFGYTSMTVEEMALSPINSFDPQYASILTGYTNFGDGRMKTWIIEPLASYNLKIGKGLLSALAGGTLQSSSQQNATLSATGYTNDALLTNLAAASSITISSSSQADYRYAAAFARLNYIWNEKYIINLTGRRDGSSRFGSGNRMANFGAVGAAWIFSNESWMQNMAFISFGKLRTSYGATGSDAIGNYQYLETFAPTRYSYGGNTGLSINRLANALYSWESNTKWEAAIDLGFFQDRVNLQASYYSNSSKNQLVGLPLPVMTGQSSVQYNLPAIVENTGWEFQLTTINCKKSAFEWTTSINLTLPQNRLVEFPALDKFPAYSSRYDVGNSVYTYKAFQYVGVNPKTGTYQVEDFNGDGIYSSTFDYIGIKKNTQLAYGGISNMIRYHNWQLDFLVQAVKQNGFSQHQVFQYPGTFSNQPVEVMERWQKEGDITDIQRFSATDPTGQINLAYYYKTASDNTIQDASFLRLKNLSLSYELPDSWKRKAHLTKTRLYVQGQNLFTLTRYKGLDPETQNIFTLPPLRTFSAGIHITL
jgi:TonB-linked SusC/RagA family outer membrane protein